jgi:hypothetical protein
MQVVEKIAVTEFDWDPDKRIRKLEERGLDFADGARALLEHIWNTDPIVMESIGLWPSAAIRCA